jgi:hypothetical protein
MQLGLVRTIGGEVTTSAARGAAQVDAIATFLGDVTRLGPELGPIRGEVFKFGNPAVEGALATAVQGGTPLSVLADTRVGVPKLQALADAGAQVTPYGVGGAHDAQNGVDLCMHSKLWSRGDHAILPTASAADAGSHQLNLNIRFGGASARAAGDATEASASGDVEASRAALERARDAGVLFNDPDVGVRHVDDAMGALVDHADHRLELVIKEFTDEDWARRVAAAQARGVDVDVTTRMMTRPVRQILEDAGVHETTVPFSRTPGLREALGQRLHFNAVFADVPTTQEISLGTSAATAASSSGAYAVIGTRYLWSPTKPGERAAREVAVALGGQAAIDARRAVDQHVGLTHVGVIRAALTGG